jgi:hypothetical protein
MSKRMIRSYMLLGSNGREVLGYHYRYRDALAEAKRVSLRYPSEPFIVLTLLGPYFGEGYHMRTREVVGGK